MGLMLRRTFRDYSLTYDRLNRLILKLSISKITKRNKKTVKSIQFYELMGTDLIRTVF